MKIIKFIIPNGDQRRLPDTNQYVDGCGAVVVATSPAVAKAETIRYCREKGYDPRWLDVADVDSFDEYSVEGTIKEEPTRKVILFSGPFDTSNWK